MATKSEYRQLCATKARREDAAMKCIMAFTKAGARDFKITRRDREVYVNFNVGPHECSFDFNGDLKIDSFLTHWHGDREYSGEFMASGRIHSRNEFHRCKATGAYKTLDEMIVWTSAAISQLVKELDQFFEIHIYEEYEEIDGLPWRRPQSYHWQLGPIDRGPFKTRAEAEADYLSRERW